LSEISPYFEKYGLISLNQLRGIVGEFEGARANAVKFRNLYPILDPFLTNLAERVEALRPAQRLIDTFVTSVNSFLTRKQLRFSTLRGISLVGDKRGDILDPDALSSGEKHLLLLLSNAVLATFTGSLVIIDEPELSLGIRWQRSLLSELLRLTEGSDVQFLVASHSVQIMGEIDEVVSPIERDQ
jgi:ABC-type dipeptide/oligopeptide/nickel transport system ATPase subunit